MDLTKVKCDQCLFSKNRIVTKERAQEVVDQCFKESKYFICHKSTIVGKDIGCIGYYFYWLKRYFGGQKEIEP